MRGLWLQLPIVLALALGSWLSAMDATGDPATTWLLCSVTAGAALFLVVRYVVTVLR
jgi:hypothetical protein